MSGNLLHAGATVTCPHGAQATALPAQSRVLVEGRPVASTADLYTVTGCAHNVGGTPQPCTTVRWAAGVSARIRVVGAPALLQSSTGICHNPEQAPQGTSTVSVVQQRVMGR